MVVRIGGNYANFLVLFQVSELLYFIQMDSGNLCLQSLGKFKAGFLFAIGNLSHPPTCFMDRLDSYSLEPSKEETQVWLVVWNMNFIFPYIGNNHPNWFIFFRGVGMPPTSTLFATAKMGLSCNASIQVETLSCSSEFWLKVGVNDLSMSLKQVLRTELGNPWNRVTRDAIQKVWESLRKS